jgi:hypothetical protein
MAWECKGVLLLCMVVLSLLVTLAMMCLAVLVGLAALVVALVLGAVVEVAPVALQVTLLAVDLVQVVLSLAADLMVATAASLVDDMVSVVCLFSFSSSSFSASPFFRLLCLLDLDLCACFERVLKCLRVSKRRQCTALYLIVPLLHCHQSHNPALE